MFGVVTVDRVDSYTAVRTKGNVKYETLWKTNSSNIMRIIVDPKSAAHFGPQQSLCLYDYLLLGKIGSVWGWLNNSNNIQGEYAYEVGDNALLLSFEDKEDSGFFKLKWSDQICVSDRDFTSSM